MRRLLKAGAALALLLMSACADGKVFMPKPDLDWGAVSTQVGRQVNH